MTAVRHGVAAALCWWVLSIASVVGAQPVGRDLDAFVGRRATQVVLRHDMVVYRVHGGSSAAGGPWYSFAPPSSDLAARNDLALPPGNAATHYDQVVIRAGTPVWVGTARYQDFRDDSQRRWGGAPQVWVPESRRDAVSVRASAIPIPRAEVPAYARRFAESTDAFRSASRDWVSYQRDATSQRVPPSNPGVVVSRFSTERAPISDAASAYGRFPGGVLLEAEATLPSPPRSIVLEHRGDAVVFVVDETARYTPSLSLEELAILYQAVFGRSDDRRFGAVAQDRFHGVDEDTVVARWLGLADTELGTLAYGYDTVPEVAPELDDPAYENPELARLARVASLDLGVLAQEVERLATGLQPRLFLTSTRVELQRTGDVLTPVRHEMSIHFAVFRDVGDGGNAIEFAERPAEELDPFVVRSTRWMATHLDRLVGRSAALSRIARYGEVLAFFRAAKRAGVAVTGGQIFTDAYERRTRQRFVPDVYTNVGSTLVAWRRSTALQLEALLVEREATLTPLGRLVVAVELAELASKSDDLDLLSRARQRIAMAARDVRGLPGGDAAPAALATWAQGHAQSAAVWRVAAPLAKGVALLGDGRAALAVGFMEVAQAACREVAAQGVDTEGHRPICELAGRKLTEARAAEASAVPAVAVPSGGIPEGVPVAVALVCVVVTGAAGLVRRLRARRQ